MDTMTTVTVQPVRGTELYCQIRGSWSPQPCHVWLDLQSGVLGADYTSESGTPMDVWYGRALRWRIPALLGSAATDLLAEVAPLAQRVLDGASIMWDGNNHRGRLTEDAQAASDEIEGLCNRDWDESAVISAWDATEWFASDPEVVAEIRRRLGAGESMGSVVAWVEGLSRQDGTESDPMLIDVAGFVLDYAKWL